MLAYPDIYNTMPLTIKLMTEKEWDELNALKNAINYNPASVHPDKMELFTTLFVKSLSYVNNVPINKPSQFVDAIQK